MRISTNKKLCMQDFKAKFASIDSTPKVVSLRWWKERGA